KAIELGDRQLPIYPVGLGTRQPPPDIVVLGIKAPTAVFKDSDIPVECRFKVTGLPAQDLVIELTEPDGERKGSLQETRIIRHHGKDRVYTERFHTRMDQQGTRLLRITVKPLMPETREVRSDNNSQTVKVNVANDRARVLLIDGEARWEYHYLASALAR